MDSCIRLVVMEVTYDGTCFGCGERNPNGLGMRFQPDGEESACEFAVPERYQSWQGIVHGGVVALMLDEAVGWAAWHAGRPSVTGKLEVRLRLPLRVGEGVRVAGRIERARRNLVYTSAYVDRLSDGVRIADATATLMETPALVIGPGGSTKARQETREG
jgi:acyl-coenzyme A thioesterase PaaI-like protein